MTAKQNVILLLGITLLVTSMVISGNWSTLWQGIFKPASHGKLIPYNPNPGQNLRPGPGIQPARHGQCPKGWTLKGGVCVKDLTT